MSTTRCWGVDGERERSADGNSFIRRARSDCWTWQCSSVGASFCYLLSKTLFSSFVAKRLGDRLVMWENEVRAVLARMEFGVPRMEFGVPRMESGLAQTGSCEGNKETIFSYMLFLRVTPFFPNWFINLASPHVGVPLGVFFIATFIGLSEGSPCSLLAQPAHLDLHAFLGSSTTQAWCRCRSSPSSVAQPSRSSRTGARSA